ncbi:hypothetical protein E0Z10_g8031 [Xylaria hypoxylon]|uniref:Apple domain-containing protein n=1 Tax=Xylaria hypoxylon TaxID=37992 RepID=A0A4Z0YMR0_9PEZI|nr:hypothetical protein E0Z10_g8031 [Xylaria hypoxylon]
MLQERQASHAPCPSGNGTMIGDVQQFVVFCDTRFKGDELFRMKMDSLQACSDLCTSFQNPRCEGAQFGGNSDCVLVGNLVPEGTRPSRFFDSAAAIFPQPGPTSSCSQQGTGTTFLSQNSRFTLQCGKIANGGDLEQQFQMTFESCIAACSTNPACSGVTYDPGQVAGFKNCYLKSTIDVSNIFPKTGVDVAVLVNNAGQAADTSTIAVAGAATAAISDTTTFVTMIPNPSTVSVPVTVVPTPSKGALADSAAGTSAEATSTGAGNGRGNVNSNQLPNFGGNGPSASTNAWIVAPIIGSIAALALILTIFVLWQRRRRRDNSTPANGRAGPISRAARELGAAASRMSRGGIFGSEKTRLGDSESDDDYRRGNNRGGFRVVSGSGRRLGLDGQEILGTGPGLGGMIVTTGGGKVVDMNTGGFRSSSSASSAGLRDSQNGLRQNRLTFLDSQPGIPAEFRGPDFK